LNPPKSLLNSQTWWLLALAFALEASLSLSLAWGAGISLFSIGVLVWHGRGRSNWSGLRIYGSMAAAVVIIRLVFRIIFAPDTAGAVLVVLPTISIRAIGGELHLLGPVSVSALAAGLADGLRLSAIILSIGMAATVASPRRLLKAAPPSLFEFATALTIAINLAPQLIESVQRIRLARRLRGEDGGARLIRSVLSATIDDSLARSLSLAASMESRGFGRTGAMRRRAVLTTRFATYLGLGILALGVFELVIDGSSLALAIAGVVLGLALLATAIRLMGLHQVRTRLQVEPTSGLDLLTRLVICALIGLTIAARLFPQPVLSWLR
jgi:energy-coupling factor transport system permease protein